MITNISRCARCGGDHKDLEFLPLVNASDEWNWWAMCPQIEQPILMKVVT